MPDYSENTIWEMKNYDRARAGNLQTALGCSAILAALLDQRGISNASQAREFLHPRLEALIDPYLINGMQAAVERIRRAVANQERVVIYGDYDVDGICSIVILKKCLEALGLEADYYIPDRFSEGYGLNKQAVEELAASGYNLMVTVDCGITANTETAYAMSHGLDVIITDHHTPHDPLPEAVAIINTKLDSIEVVQDLSGAATAYKLVQALGQGCLETGQIREWLDLVALATVADIVPLRGENRILVKYGLEQMSRTANTGIRSLLEELQLDKGDVDSWQVGFLIAPKLNSAGRLDTARRSVDLLLSDNPAESRQTARLLSEMNQERRQIEEKIVAEAIAIIERDYDLEDHPALVVEQEGWHQGVVGIVASRLVDRYHRPTIVISWEGDLGRGSARSTGDFDMHSALTSCQAHLVSFGGHRMAAGLHIERSRLEDFRQALNDYARSAPGKLAFMKKYRIDLELSSSELSRETLEQIQMLKPFGEGNPGPQFVIKGAAINDAALVGRGQEHLRFRLEPGHHAAIAFNLAPRMQLPWQLCKQDFLFRLEENNYNGPSLQLKMRDIKCSYQADDPLAMDNSPEQARLLALFRSTVTSLQQKQPVVYVYPTVRALQKHRTVISHYIRENHQVELHGMLDADNRRMAEGMLTRRAPRLFLLTSAYWDRWCQRTPAGGSCARTVYWWPLENTIPDSGSLFGIFPVRKDPNGLNWHQEIRPGQMPCRKWIYYANRPGTINQALSIAGPHFREAGLEKGIARREARRDFNSSQCGILISDGSHTPNHEYVDEAEAIYMADCPFGLYELDAILPEQSTGASLPLVLGYGEQGIAANRDYLQRMYPGPVQLEPFWDYLRSSAYNRIEKTIQNWLLDYGQTAGRMLKKWELRPMLQVLEDRGLLKYHLQGNIITIIIEDRQGAVYTDTSGPLTEEGQAEFACFQHWLNTAQADK